jgi:hypothetical protein
LPKRVYKIREILTLTLCKLSFAQFLRNVVVQIPKMGLLYFFEMRCSIFLMTAGARPILRLLNLKLQRQRYIGRLERSFKVQENIFADKNERGYSWRCIVFTVPWAMVVELPPRANPTT